MTVITIQQYRSAARTTQAQRRILEGLGLRRIGAERQLPDCPSIRGMIQKLPHLVRILETTDEVK